MRHYYAEFCPYGTDTMSEYDQLRRFNSCAERNRFVVTCNEIANAHGYNDVAEAVTLASRLHRYPAKSANAEWFEIETVDIPHMAINQRRDYIM